MSFSKTGNPFGMCCPFSWSLMNLLTILSSSEWKLITTNRPPIANTSKISVNYPEYAHKLCKKVGSSSKNMGILVCGSGMGMSMAANRHKRIRAAVCYSIKNTKLSRLHNNANIITLGSRLTKKNTAFKCIEIFMSTKFEGGRHKKRVEKI